MKKLKLSNNKAIFGVCAGIGEYLDLDPVIIRSLWIILTIFSAGFPGTLIYIILAIIIPNN